MGGAFVAQADDPSAVYYNPAGIVQLEGVQVSVGISPIIPKGTFTSATDDTLDVLVPSGDRWLLALGFGSHYEKWTVDFAYNYLLDEDRAFNNEAGDYGTISGTHVGRLSGEFTDVQAHVFALNVSYRF